MIVMYKAHFKTSSVDKIIAKQSLHKCINGRHLVHQKALRALRGLRKHLIAFDGSMERKRLIKKGKSDAKPLHAG